MVHKFIRTIAVLIVLALAFSLVVGCTADPDEQIVSDSALSGTASDAETTDSADVSPTSSDESEETTEEPASNDFGDESEDESEPVESGEAPSAFDETEEPIPSEEGTSDDDASHSHSYTSEVTKAATCASAGTCTYTCSVCGDSYTESMAKTDHTYTSEMTREPECEKTGVKTFTCTACGDSYTETIAAMEHDWDETGDACIRCGAIRDTAAEEIYQILISFKSKYPEGTSWTNENRSYTSYTICPEYSWYTGYGCVAFAFELSDAAFGDLPRTEHYDISKIRVGDILRINQDTHSVIVLEVHSDGVVIAEGNYNRSVSWGRFLSTAELQKNLTFIWTRYPDA